MKKIYRGWWISTIDKEQMQAVKGKERIIGTEQQIKYEIDRRQFEEMKKEAEVKQMSGAICDGRFEIIEKAKRHLIEATNIETSQDEMKVLDSFLFRCWQMGWLNKYDNFIENTNTADMKEVKYGEWIEQEAPYINTYECSNCKKWFVIEDGTPEENNYNYCPNCGSYNGGKND